MSKESHKPLWAVLHIAATLSIFVSLLTGLRIAVLDYESLLRFSYFLPQGQMHSNHVISGFIFACMTFAYGYLRFKKKSAPTTKMQSPRRPAPRFIRRYHHVINRLVYVISFLSIITGTVLLLDSTFLNKTTVLLIHFYSALSFIAYLFLHGGAYAIEKGLSTLHLVFYPLKKIQKPQSKTLIVLLLAMICAGYMLNKNIKHDLLVIKIDEDEYIKIDGKADEVVWQKVKALTINTHSGANFNQGTTDITIRAMHNGKDAFFFIQWQDVSESLQHLPLVKTEHGWKVKEDGFYRFDETQNYEDKLAIMIANQCDLGAAGTAHLGPKPLPDKPQNWSGKGYHYSQDELVDLWHWKAVRTNKMRLMDDNYIGQPDIVRNGNRRYTAGYQTDAHESGGYRMNWLWYTPTGVIPKRLPIDKDLLKPYQNNDSLPLKKTWVLPWFGTRPYKKENDTYPIGTIMPSTLYTSNKFEGDRANVKAYGLWNNGQWSLEVFRKLKTGSIKDVDIVDGVCMWIAAFDHAQASHTRHTLPLKVRFEK